jgi:dUTP pyrophosphatase
VKPVRVKVQRLPHGSGLPLPTYQSAGAAGLDLMAAVPADTPLSIAPGQWATVPTGIAIALPRGTEAQVRPRSGLAARNGITVLNTPGTIDADYRGEVQIILVNFGCDTFVVTRGMRIAQMVIVPVLNAQLFEQKKLAKTKRGTKGFGSTDKRVIDKQSKHRP